MITLFNVSKKFVIPDKKRRSLFKNISRAVKGQYTNKTIWALDKVSIDIGKGEMIGIIGPNGSGKSTLLRIIGDIYRPTSGVVKVKGEVTPVLQLDDGFLPDLSLKDNVFLFGAIMGLDRGEIARNFSRMIDFAELNEFVNATVRTLSLGMKERLAFSVIIEAYKDILLFDEIFAIGDQRFREKCFGAVEKMKREGKTILFSSHDLDLIRRFCDRVLLLNQGRVASVGDAETAITEYMYLVKARGEG